MTKLVKKVVNKSCYEKQQHEPYRDLSIHSS